MKKVINKFLICILLSITLLLGINCRIVFGKTNSLEVIPGGETIGIKLNTGIYVAGKYEVETIDGKKFLGEKRILK